MAKYQSAPAVHVVVKCKEKGHRWLDRYKDKHTYTYRDRYRKGNYILKGQEERERRDREGPNLHVTERESVGQR